MHDPLVLNQNNPLDSILLSFVNGCVVIAWASEFIDKLPFKNDGVM
jgi:hypothetical protein